MTTNLSFNTLVTVALSKVNLSGPIYGGFEATYKDAIPNMMPKLTRCRLVNCALMSSGMTMIMSRRSSTMLRAAEIVDNTVIFRHLPASLSQAAYIGRHWNTLTMRNMKLWANM